MKKVGPTEIRAIHRASCHCGAVVLELDLPNGIVDPRRYQRRVNPSEYGFNIGCLEGVDPYDIANVPTSDGVNHPSDRRPENRAE